HRRRARRRRSGRRRHDAHRQRVRTRPRRLRPAAGPRRPGTPVSARGAAFGRLTVMATPTTLYRGGPVHTPADPHATALLVAGDSVRWVGPDAGAPRPAPTVHLATCPGPPACAAPHVHLTDTGLAHTGLVLSGVRSPRELLDAVAAAARHALPDAVLLGHGWDESSWPDPTLPD